VRQYANGHTYGLGGQPHTDDARPGTFTLLYYPMPVWLPEWEGETLFYDLQGELIGGVKPAPNRAVLFDSRIPHCGRAPGRACPALRVTVAFKLETA
jgi:SM-20-related protein